MSNTFETPTTRDMSPAPDVIGIKAQTSLQGVPVTIVYGTARIAGNVMHAKKVVQVVNASSSNTGGKWGVDVERKSYTYNAPVALGLCEGPIAGIGKVWQDNNTANTWTILSGLGFALFTGTSAQAAWGYLTTNYPGEAVPYQYTAYVVHATWPLADGGTLPNYTWEVTGFASFGGPGLVVDASPADVATDLWTDATHGLGLSSSLLGVWTAWANYCGAAGLFCSPVLNTAGQAASDILTTLAQISNTAPVWSEGLLKMIPYGDTALSGNGKTFTPSVTPAYDLTDNDFLPGAGADPILVTRSSPADAFNCVRVEFENRANNYNTEIAEAKDLALIDLYGLRVASTVSLPWIKDPVVARQVAQLLLQRSGYIRNTYQFSVGWKYCLLEPMDLVTLTDVGLGMATTAVRIIAIDESDDDSITLTAEDFPAGIATSAAYTSQTGSGTQPNTGVAPGATVGRLLLAPAPLAGAPVEVWVAASGGVNWGGCDVWVSTDGGTSYRRAGAITAPAAFGTLAANLATGTAVPGTDSVNTLSVDLTASRGALASVSATDLANYVSLCYVDTEWVAFQTATLTGSFAYNLTTLKRGLYGSTIPASHASGTVVVRCDSAAFRLPIPNPSLGSTLYVKLPAFNAFGGASESLGAVTAITITLPTAAQMPSAAPQALILTVSQTDTAETMTLTGVLAAGGVGPLTYRVRQDINGTPGAWSASASLPGAGVTYVVTRDLENNINVALEVTDSGTGQLARVFYTVASKGQARAGRALDTNSRLTDQRNARAIISANLSAIVKGASPLSVANTGVVTISAFTMQYGFGTVSYNSGSVASGFGSGTQLWLYCSDPGLAGGAVTYIASIHQYDPLSSSDYVYIGTCTVPASGSSGGSGGGGFQ